MAFHIDNKITLILSNLSSSRQENFYLSHQRKFSMQKIA